MFDLHYGSGSVDHPEFKGIAFIIGHRPISKSSDDYRPFKFAMSIRSVKLQ